jgi:IS1 family transposase
MLARASILFIMNRLSTAERARIVSCLVEGNSLRATARMTGFARMTIEKLLRDLGAACTAYQNEHLRNLRARRIQCDEIWSFCYAKAKNVPESKQGQFGYGDVWTWTAIDADSKLVLSWLIAGRDTGAAYEFMQDVASRLSHRVQLTTDGHRPYLEAVEAAFGIDVDYAVLQKIYGSDQSTEKRYSPAVCIGCDVKEVSGSPDPKHISTSYIERQNLTMRMHMRRFTRLTNAFSKKVEMHAAAVALHFMHYNFGRIHQTLRVSPAMEAGVTDHVWSHTEIAGLLENHYTPTHS